MVSAGCTRRAPLRQAMKSALLKQHFLNPVGMKRIDSPSYRATCRSDTCSDVIRMTVTVDGDGVVRDIGTEVYGCGYSIAGASLFNSVALGIPVEDVAAIVDRQLAAVLPEVPEGNRRCVELPKKAFSTIYGSYRSEKNR